jgi:N-acetyltransferase
VSTFDIPLIGTHVRLEPLEHRHLGGLVTAARADPSLYQWSTVPADEAGLRLYIDAALSWRDAGHAFPFAIVRTSDDLVIGSTRFWKLEQWQWPAGHPRAGRREPDVCEIGYTWFASSAIRTAANTETKYLMLQHAFETWNVLRVSFHTDARNERSRRALLRIGAQFEGVLRAHRIASDAIPRDSWRFSIVGSEWPLVKERLRRFLLVDHQDGHLGFT